jgi:hypothetical protein
VSILTGAPLIAIHNKTCFNNKITTILYCLMSLHLQQFNSLLYSSSTHAILTQGTVFTHIWKPPRRWSPRLLIMTYPLAWPPGIDEYPQYPSVEHSKICAEAVSHPGTSRLLFYEYWCFGHTTPFTYCFRLLYSRKVGIFERTKGIRTSESRDN